MAYRDVTDDLADYLMMAAARPFAWGSFDCCLYGSDWIKLRTGKDPARKLRGTYRTRAGARRHMLRAGGFVPLTASLMEPHGFTHTETPALGDVAVVRTPQGDVIGIKTRIGYAVKAERGLFTDRFECLYAWKIE